jgi:ABC-type molybdate transport system substrate-binding protein
MGEAAMQVGGIIAAVVRGVVPVILAQAAVAHAGEIKVFSTNGMRSVVEELAPQFERTARHKLNLTFGMTSALRRQIETGEPFDVAIMGGRSSTT